MAEYKEVFEHLCEDIGKSEAEVVESVYPFINGQKEGIDLHSLLSFHRDVVKPHQNGRLDMLKIASDWFKENFMTGTLSSFAEANGKTVDEMCEELASKCFELLETNQVYE